MKTETQSTVISSESKLTEEPFNSQTINNFEQLKDVIESIHRKVNNVDQITATVQDEDNTPNISLVDYDGIIANNPIDKLFEELYIKLSYIDDNLNRLQHRISI